MSLRQILSGQGRAKVGVLASYDLHRSCPALRRQTSVRPSPPQSVHHHLIFLPLHPPQQFPHPTLADSHALGRPRLSNLFSLGLVQPLQPVPLLLVHHDQFLCHGPWSPRSIGTSHLAATPATSEVDGRAGLAV